jgi:hypothetical protein
MTEDFLHYIWQYKLFDTNKLQTISGEPLEILNYGMRNTNSGPDFSQARIKIGNITLAGQIEIHRRSSEWLLHGHEKDSAYENVVLHVVYEHDTDKKQEQLIGKPTLTLNGRFNESLWSTYENWLQSKREIPCGNAPALVNPLKMRFWLERLFVERLSIKVQRAEAMMRQANDNKEEVAYRMLLRYFGGNVNAAAFERLSALLPYSILMKHQNQLIVMEALLFGVSGLLPEQQDDNYVNTLNEHWKFYRLKYHLQQMDAREWKLMRMRPVGFPGHRLAQLAAFIRNAFPLYSRLCSVESYAFFESLFNIQLSSYWKNHYHFGVVSNTIIEKPGKDFVRNIMVNVVLPLMYFEGIHQIKDELKERAVVLAAEAQAEKNRIINIYDKLGLTAKTAAESQALIQLYQNYCQKKQCLSCTIGSEVLRNTSS